MQERDDTSVIAELECLQCRTRASVQLSGEKFKELSAAWKLTQECEVCGKSTEWSFAEASVEAAEQADFWDWLATTGEAFLPSLATVPHERRKEPRLYLRVLLRISSVRGEGEEVTSEDISKSGFCFSSSKAYPIGETIHVTLQTAGSLAPQTKTGTIVRSSTAQEGKTLYGVRLET